MLLWDKHNVAVRETSKFGCGYEPWRRGKKGVEGRDNVVNIREG
jgi:hypothetical protein